MKIVFIGQKGLPSHSGGIEKHVEDLATELVARGHDVFAYTRPNYTDPARTTYNGVNLISLPSIPTKNLDAISHTFLAVLDLIRRPADIVHFHGIGPCSLILLAKLIKPSAKIVATFHCQDYYLQKWSLFARLYLRFGEWVACTIADKTITVSRSLTEYVAETYSHPSTYIPSGVHAPAIAEASKISVWGLSKGSYILAVSRLIRDKGLHYLVEAFKQATTDKKLVIVGDGAYTDEYVVELKKLAADDPRIIFTGRQQGEILNELFSNAFLFAQPSESEGLSIALLEAMSYGLPILASDIPGNREALGSTGILFASRNSFDAALQLSRMIDMDDEARSQLGSAARSRVTTEYGWQSIVTATEELYAELASATATSRLYRLAFASRFVTFL